MIRKLNKFGIKIEEAWNCNAIQPIEKIEVKFDLAFGRVGCVTSSLLERKHDLQTSSAWVKCRPCKFSIKKKGENTHKRIRQIVDFSIEVNNSIPSIPHYVHSFRCPVATEWTHSVVKAIVPIKRRKALFKNIWLHASAQSEERRRFLEAELVKKLSSCSSGEDGEIRFTLVMSWNFQRSWQT